MPGGSHITEEDCREIRRLKDRGRWDYLIAHQMEVSVSAVQYHIYGNCDHPSPTEELDLPSGDDE